MLHDILTARLNARMSQAETSTERAQSMAYTQQPGRVICDSLISLQELVEETQPQNKEELSEAIRKLWKFRGCHKMRSE